MWRCLVLVALACPLVVEAAPRLPPQGEFVLIQAEGKCVTIEEIGSEQIWTTFSFVGKKATAYTIEMYAEPNGTGERAILVQSTTVVTNNLAGSNTGTASGSMVAGARFSQIKAPAELPIVAKGNGWAVGLVLKSEQKVVATSSFTWVNYPGPK